MNDVAGLGRPTTERRGRHTLENRLEISMHVAPHPDIRPPKCTIARMSMSEGRLLQNAKIATIRTDETCRGTTDVNDPDRQGRMPVTRPVPDQYLE